MPRKEGERERALQYCKSQFLTEEGIIEVFQQIDKEQDGYLSEREISQALKDLNIRLTDQQMARLFKHLRSGQKTQKISLEQFTMFVQRRQKLLAEVFIELDIRKDGVLEYKELKHALHKIGICPNKGEAKLLIEELDSNNDGKVEFREFCNLFLLCHEVNVENIFETWRQSVDLGIDKGDTYSMPSDRNVSAWKILLAGGVAGAISRTSTAPFDRLKVLLQAGGKVNGVQIVGIVSGLKAIYHEGGVLAFFKGNGTNVLKIAPESAVKFFAYERLKLIVAKDPEHLTGGERFIAGAMAGIVAQTTIYPLEVTKTRLAIAPVGVYRGIYDCLYKVYKNEGPKALFRGLGASLSGIIPYAGVDLSVFFTLKEAWVVRNPDQSPGVAILLLMGATSSFCGQITAYPLQLVRTRLQAQGMPGTKAEYTGIANCFVKVYRQGGVLGFYRGITPNFMKAIPAISISYVVYEKMREILKA